MTYHKDQRDVPYAPGAMFDLVANVEAYPDFLPWCTALRVKRRTMSAACDILLTEMIARYKVFTERLTSEVILDKDKNRISAHYIDGPFKNLRTSWCFTTNGTGGTILTFEVDFEFKNKILQSAASYAFEDIFKKMADAFVARAAQLHRLPA